MEVIDSITFCQRDFKSTSFVAFEDMRKKGELCDFKITLRNKEIRAHRVVVAAGIPYFRATFVRDVDKEITLGSIDSMALESLINFAYSNRLNISTENVNHLLFASHFLRLGKVLEACVEFLSKRLDINNVWQVRTAALSLDITHLIEISNLYILSNIEKLSKSVEFLNLPESHLVEILSQNDLNASSEKVLFDAVIQWVKVSSERQAVLPELIDQIRLVYLPIEYLSEQAASQEVIRTSTICRDMIDEVKNYHLFPKNKSLFPNVKTNPRIFSGLYSICEDHSGISVRYYDFGNQMWHSVSEFPECGGRVLHSAVVNEELYIFREKEINIFNTKTSKQCVPLQSWNTIMDGAAVATVESVIYCFGSSAEDYYDRICYFDPARNMFLVKGKMKKGRYCAAAVTLLRDASYIYVTGGFDCDTVEKYCSATNQCSEAASMLSKRAHHSAASMNGKIYVCGGSFKSRLLRSSEVYDPMIDQWSSVSSMCTGRKKFSFVTHNSTIYALGGSNARDQCIRATEIYHPESNEWESSFLIPEGFQIAVVI